MAAQHRSSPSDSLPSAPPLPPDFLRDDRGPRASTSVPPPQNVYGDAGQAGAGGTPRPASRDGAAAASSASSAAVDRVGMSVPWTVPGVVGGALLGATVGGLVGVVVGTVGGAAAGLYRDVTGQTVLQGWLAMPDQQKRSLLAKAGFAYAGRAEAARQATGETSGVSAVGGNDAGLTPEALDNLPVSTATAEEPACVLCCTNKVNVMFQPCGHAQLCSRCAAEVLRMAYTGCCPVCRQRISRTTRIFL
mmetsp:Transcript_21163/g.58747  ORF Transcript_21163/g.58747 Transcript_21163/m.58747 type:complete len:248 (+) Transcript_21163:223-966(+)